MTKYEQKCINLAVEQVLDSLFLPYDLRWERLRSCSAKVAQAGDWYVLRSYRTIVAVIDQNTGICYDFLRKVYGYTSTSAQHIAKFRNDYGATSTMTWREV